MKKFLLASAIIASMSVAAHADSYGYVTVANNLPSYSGDPNRISWAYYREQNSDRWSRNMLVGTIHTGDARTFRIGVGGQNCLGDIKFKVHTGEEYVFGVDLCGTNNFSLP